MHQLSCLALQANKNGNGNGKSSGPPVVGFCFSFAVEQAALNSGKLMVWTKGFNVDGVIGKDVVALLSGQPPCMRVPIVFLPDDSVNVKAEVHERAVAAARHVRRTAVLLPARARPL